MSWQDQYGGYGDDYNSPIRNSITSSNQMNNNSYGNNQQEQDLALALKKALTIDETAPKQKHVRSIILYSWDCKGSGSFWTALKSFPMIGDDIVQYKALILFHKAIRQGHPTLLVDAISQSSWLDSVVRNTNDYATGPVGGSSYAPMIKAYVEYLRQKLDYHRLRPFFSGTFDYEEYVSLKGVQDPNEGYETISELMDLLEKLDRFARTIFGNVKSYGANECRIAALVPLVEESYGIYRFIVSMMTAMHTIIGSVEVLAPLRDRFKNIHFSLVKFYNECSGIRYLTSLVTVPKLDMLVDFMEAGPPVVKPKGGDSKKVKKDTSQEDEFMREQERLFQQAENDLEKKKRAQEEQDRQQQQLQQQQYAKQQAEMMRVQAEGEKALAAQREREALLRAQQEQYMAMQGVNQQIEWYRQQGLRDKEMLGQYAGRFEEMGREMAALRLEVASDEINQWKQKYEALAKLYAQLRKEHLDLLQKFKTIKDGTGKISEQARKKLEGVEAALTAKSNELTDVVLERNRLQGQVDLVRAGHQQELSRLQLELEQTRQAVRDLSLTKGSEVQALVLQHSKDLAGLEGLLADRQGDLSRLGIQLADALGNSERAKKGWEEERLVLQTGLDQALEMLKMHQDQSIDGIGKREERIAILEGKHRDLIFQMMDNMLDTCMTTVQESIFVLEGAEESRSTITPEFVLVLIEKATQKCNDFSVSFVKLVGGGDPKDAVTNSASLAHSISQLLRNGKEMERLITGVDNEQEDIIEMLKKTGSTCLNLFSKVKYFEMIKIEPSKRTEHVLNLSRQTTFQIGTLIEIITRLASFSSSLKLEGDLTTAVEREMANAAKAIQEASSRLEILLRQGGDLNVHAAILQAAIALTTAITYLIKCATDSQNEIVLQNKGAQTTTAFYKKNNNWTDGLISAAHSVANSTMFLVTTADGLVQTTHTWEQVVVAAQDVGVSTTQLVAASRVKAAAFSKTQDKLEHAATSVREATKLVVRAAKDASKTSAESHARDQVGSLNKHDAKVKEMEQQVRILELEKNLGVARFTLGEMRKQNYHEEG